ncbi:MAG: phosphotransferase family protein [Chloroflexi bacterium]|nr:MAG: phosphotransferase family protein [Chloroflexota bacterium]
MTTYNVHDPDEIRTRLAEYLTAMTGYPAKVPHVEQLPGGASRETWRVDAVLNEQENRFVLRRDLPTVMYDKALSREQEYHILQLVHDSGVAVPQPRWYNTEPQILGSCFLIMDYVEGFTIGRKIVSMAALDGARQLLPGQMAEQLAHIHGVHVPSEAYSFLTGFADDETPVQRTIREIREMLEKLHIDSPVFEFGLRWCEEHAPQTQEKVLLHGDFRIGNVIVTESGLQAIIDWEFAHIGDPHEDLAWPTLRDWRFGQGQQRFGGIADREPFLIAYEEASGRPVDRDTVDFWEILGNIRWAATALSQSQRHLSGGDLNIELASLGRRSAEMQLEMLLLIQMQGL